MVLMKINAILRNPRNSVQIEIEVASTFFSKFCGLMLRKNIKDDHGLILSESSESIVNSSIHMFFMRFDITVLWLDHDFIVVDKCKAYKWHPAYFSKRPAKHVVEMNISQFDNFCVGDKLILLEANN